MCAFGAGLVLFFGCRLVCGGGFIAFMILKIKNN